MMNLGVSSMLQNLGMGFETLIIIVLVLGGLIFFARDFTTGVVALMIMSGATFVWFYSVGFIWALPLALFIITLILLSFTLMKGQTQQGVFI